MDGIQCGSDEEQEEESSSSSSQTLEDELAEFRKRWREELKLGNDGDRGGTSIMREEKLHKAIDLYHLGVKAEQSGLMYEAVRLYRKAEQLEPDVESHLRDASCTDDEISDESDADNGNNEGIEEEEINDNTDLVAYFSRLQRKRNSFCTPMHPLLSSHLSDLPPEVVQYILQWVISRDLDLRSLEQCSMVSRGLYLLARDPQLWRKACQRVWGNGTYLDMTYGSWRKMWILKPRVRFNGIYINKASYIRHGDTSFQDQFYRPFHTVNYYRYMRFFPEGKVLMVTTPEEPISIVPQLKTRTSNLRTAVGQFCIFENKVRVQFNQGSRNLNNRKYRSDHGGRTFHMEFEVKAHHQKPHWILLWKEYFYVSQVNGNVSQFELSPSHYPPLWFSRVRSYTDGSDAPL